MNTEKKIPQAGEAVKLEQYVHKEKYRGGVMIASVDMSEHGYPCLGKTTVTFTMPDGDAIKAMVSSLEKQIEREQAVHHVKITGLRDKIQQLLAIGHDGGAE